MLVIDSNGNNLGVLPLQAALNHAMGQSLDLVQVSPGNVEKNILPTCKIMDYGKFCYEQDKKEKEARKKQKVTVVKEIRLSVNIGDNDFETKALQAVGFLEQGNKVKVSIKFRGRENSAPSRGAEVMNKFAERCSSVGKVESQPKLEGRQMMMVISCANLQKTKREGAGKVNNAAAGFTAKISKTSNTPGAEIKGFRESSGVFEGTDAANNLQTNNIEAAKQNIK